MKLFIPFLIKCCLLITALYFVLELFFSQKTVTIGPTEFKLLHFLMKNSNIIFNRNQILDKVWGNKSEIDDRTVDVHIKRLRDCLKKTNDHNKIETVRGMGYRFNEN